MSKTLTFVRHGKSEWGSDSLSDIDRPLKQRGIDNSYEMAERLLLKDIIPDLILTSTAARAMHTATIFSRILKINSVNIILNSNLYLTDPNTILEIANRTNNEISSLMIFGHNPAFTDIANTFLDNRIHNMPTAGIASFKFKIDSWNGFYKSKPYHSFFDYPKNI
ncbi:MAG: histidine phosphatase family protein [Bacteroidales bacterium]|nr:histidine phosphatase family protein [Bacteroidales bacterium]